MRPAVPCEAEVALAEDLLVLSMFKEAAESSKALLDRLIYSSLKQTGEVRKRAAFVWLQAEFASGGLQHSWKYLQQAFQDNIGLDLATVWAVLMVEAGHHNETERTLHSILEDCKPANPGVQNEILGKEQEPEAEQRALLRLYMQIIHQHQHKPAAASQWLQSSGLISEGQRKVMLDELQPASSTKASGRAPGRAKPGDISRAVSNAPASAVHKQQVCNSAEESSKAELPLVAELSAHPAGSPGATAAGGDTVAGDASFQNGSGQHTGSSMGFSSSWWGRTSHKWREWLDHAPEDWGFTPVQCSLGLAGGAVLLYAALAERQAMARVARRVGKKLSDGFIDISTAALSLQPNPHAATSSTRLAQARSRL
ncbi:hypothetical protein WJX74_009156 [Apatococcus lobatus]|uniref:Uncharacterized protein n=1 Tax=Apatococcus lobatus TaxID=904363 RepID=A0AAW1RUG7_9CHLO